jgi:hypothetical protein
MSTVVKPTATTPTLPGALQEVILIGAAVSAAGAALTGVVKEFGNVQANADVVLGLAVLSGLLLAAREFIGALVSPSAPPAA